MTTEEQFRFVTEMYPAAIEAIRADERARVLREVMSWIDEISTDVERKMFRLAAEGVTVDDERWPGIQGTLWELRARVEQPAAAAPAQGGKE